MLIMNIVLLKMQACELSMNFSVISFEIILPKIYINLVLVDTNFGGCIDLLGLWFHLILLAFS